jgi:hypothetical protein
MDVRGETGCARFLRHLHKYLGGQICGILSNKHRVGEAQRYSMSSTPTRRALMDIPTGLETRRGIGSSNTVASFG